MPLYSFIVGRKSLLSLAEIVQVLGNQDTIISFHNDVIICNLEKPLEDAQESLDRLGGTIKIAEIFSEIPKNKSLLSSEISNYLAKKFQSRIGKLSYGISVHSISEGHEQLLKFILKKIKNNLEQQGIKNRFINRNFHNLQSAAIKGEKLLQKGAEILILETPTNYFLADTIALQDFENYSKRDYGRPARDPHLGMLPPKLAQIMINLAGKNKLATTHNTSSTESPMQTLYDPFCGIGTVLTEALLLNFNIMGSDLNADVVAKAQKNIDWLLQITPKLQRSKPKIKIFTKDATRLDEKDSLSNIDLVVTESYLGPPISQLPQEKTRTLTFRQINMLALNFFAAIHPLIQPGVPIIISFPFYRSHNTFFFIENIAEEISKLGFTVEPLIAYEIYSKLNLPLPKRKSLLYDRPDQIVGREIWKFSKK